MVPADTYTALLFMHLHFVDFSNEIFVVTSNRENKICKLFKQYTEAQNRKNFQLLNFWSYGISQFVYQNKQIIQYDDKYTITHCSTHVVMFQAFKWPSLSTCTQLSGVALQHVYYNILSCIYCYIAQFPISINEQ